MLETESYPVAVTLHGRVGGGRVGGGRTVELSMTGAEPGGDEPHAR